MNEEPILLDEAQVAAILNVSVRWVSQNQRTLPFRKELSPRKIRYDRDGLLRWIDTRPR
jgi:Helix-turn-helix domain